MSKKKKQAEKLTSEELETQKGEKLPDREVMSILPVADAVALPPIFPHEALPPPPEE
jgi:hypothetical protein